MARATDFTFSGEELIVLRDACIEEAQRCKSLTTERARKRVAILRALAENFQEAINR